MKLQLPDSLRKILKSRIFVLILLLSAVVTAMILVIDFVIFFEDVQLFSSIAAIAAITFVFPVFLFVYNDFKRKKQMEDMFPIFLRDFVESIRGGLTLPQSFKSLRRNDYKALSPLISKIASQLDWGIPVETVFLSFAKETQSKLIARVVSSVVESHRFGGNLADTFEALSATSLEVERLKQERKLYLQSQMLTGYIIFFVFLVVIIGLGKFLVPSLSEVSQAGLNQLTTGAAAPADLAAQYKRIFRNLILLQGLFAGLAVGKMAEGSTIAGMKHSMFMMSAGLIVFTLFG